MGTAIPKQFLPLKGKPVLYHSTHTFLEVFPGIRIILVLPEAHISYSNMLLQAFDRRIELTIVTGGDTRFHSVQNGLKETDPGSIVFIHDGVRPLVSRELLERCYYGALEKGSAIPAVPVTDSIRQWNGTDFAAIDRNRLRSIQTPQTFRAALIQKAFEQPYRESFTDEATVLEHAGMPAYLVEGDRSNIKVTTPEDLLIAEALMPEP